MQSTENSLLSSDIFVIISPCIIIIDDGISQVRINTVGYMPLTLNQIYKLLTH